MSDIEPTEEQEQASRAVFYGFPDIHLDMLLEHGAPRVARLLAEREAKLREGRARIIEAVHVQMAATALPQPLIDVVRGVYAEHPYALHRIEDLEKVCHALQDERDTLRARVAELESEVRIAWADCADGSCEACAKCVDQAKHQRDFATARVAELSALEHAAATCAEQIDEIAELYRREAQHLADIKALREAVAAWLDDPWLEGRRKLGEDFIAATAHYDDAKAAEGEATCPKCTDDARPVGDGERWVCSVCRRPCRIPLNDTEGGAR